MCNAAAPIVVNHLQYAYADGQWALRDINLTVNASERVALVGPNGAGKTTLFLCLCGVLPVRPGMVQVAGLDPAIPAHRRQLPRHLGVVFAQSDDQLIHDRVEDEVAFGPLNLGLPIEQVREQVAQALAQVGLSGQADRVPYRMSEGEKKRVALACVLAMQPSILLLDEPTIYLDPRGRRDLMKLLGQLPGTQLIATHDLDLARHICTRVLLVSQGQIAADGPPEAILNDTALLHHHGL
jgi:cobalt/nickel transport system ATP-binding protein